MKENKNGQNPNADESAVAVDLLREIDEKATNNATKVGENGTQSNQNGTNIDNLIDSYELDFFADDDAPNYTLFSGGVPFASEGNLITVTGPPKAGKSTLCAMITAAAANPEIAVCGLNSQKINKIFLFDSEQTKYYAKRQIKHACTLSNLNPVDFVERGKFYGLRQASISERYKILFHLLSKVRNALVIIDGVTDFVSEGINDEKGAVELCAELMRVAEANALTIIAVIHTNSGGQQARGWVGSELTRKVETSIHIKANDAGVFDVTFPYTRGRKPSPFSFIIDDDSGLPRIVNDVPKDPGRPEKYGVDFWKELFRDRKELTYAELMERLIAKGYNQSTSKSNIKRAKLKGFLLQPTERGPYSLNLLETVTQSND